MSDYQRIAQAIDFIRTHIHQQPTLNQVAAQLHLSPGHFQRLFSRWTGVTPKTYLQYLTLAYAKALLRQPTTVFETSCDLGLSSASRLYDHFVTLDAVTPGEYRTCGQGVNIEYATGHTPFGKMFIAMTPRGICKMCFIDQGDANQAIGDLKKQWPGARFQGNSRQAGIIIDSLFTQNTKADRPLSLLVSGTNFQVNVWKALLRIPSGSVTSYGQLAADIGHQRAGRAVGSAIGANPVALLIPCHRVICNNGDITGYHRGNTRKQAILAWEAARRDALT